jgi:hypothetical protein
MGEHLDEDYGIKINKETLRQIMIGTGVRRPNPNKRKVKHVLRERLASFGMMRQFDGSYDDWLENGLEGCLLCGVDDATGQVVAKFSK